MMKKALSSNSRTESFPDPLKHMLVTQACALDLHMTPSLFFRALYVLNTLGVDKPRETLSWGYHSHWHTAVRLACPSWVLDLVFSSLAGNVCCPVHFLPEKASFLIVENLMRAEAISLCHCLEVVFVTSLLSTLAASPCLVTPWTLVRALKWWNYPYWHEVLITC